MKVILNVITNFEGKSLKSGDGIDVSRKVAERWINRGIAHYPEKQKGNIVLPQKIPKLNKDLIIPLKTKKKLKEFSTELKTGEAISKPLKGIKVKLGEIGELIEPIKKPKRRYRKKKSKTKGWKID